MVHVLTTFYHMYHLATGDVVASSVYSYIVIDFPISLWHRLTVARASFRIHVIPNWCTFLSALHVCTSLGCYSSNFSVIHF